MSSSEFIRYSAVFNKEAAHFLGEGTFRNGANLPDMNTAVRYAFHPLGYPDGVSDAYEYLLRRETLRPGDGTVSTVIGITPGGQSLLKEAYVRRIREQQASQRQAPRTQIAALTRRLMDQGPQGTMHQPDIVVPPIEELLRDRIQTYCDRNVWAARKELANAISVARLNV